MTFLACRYIKLKCFLYLFYSVVGLNGDDGDNSDDDDKDTSPSPPQRTVSSMWNQDLMGIMPQSENKPKEAEPRKIDSNFR